MRNAPGSEGRRPFLKWAGGKRQLLGQIEPYLPARFGRYHEPFVGGGALFFHLAPERATLTDSNERLVRCYRGLRDSVDEVVRLLRGYPHDRRFFEKLRARDTDAASDAEVAAWLIYLNKTGFNGLYRVNRHNVYNVPFGRYANPTICDEPNLRACARVLRRARIDHGDFERAARRARCGDLVYLDPPYVPLNHTAYFTSYTAGGFGMADQVRLRDVALGLKRRGVHVLLSNSGAAPVRALYRDDFELIEVHARRDINSRADRRHAIVELLIR
jgi:DNA adenine methylase